MLFILGLLVAFTFLIYLVLAIIATRKKNATAKKKWMITIGLFVLVNVLGNNNSTEQKSSEITSQPNQNTVINTTTIESTNNKEISSNKVESKQDSNNINSEKINKKATDPMLSRKEVLAYTDNLTGRTFIKKVEVGKNNINIQFYNDYTAYKADNPASGVTKDDYTDYFATGDQINKLLMQESTRLFKEFPATQSVKMTLPFEGKTYIVDLTKDEVEQFYNVSFDDMKANDTWNEEISNVFFNKTDREKFVNTFVIVQ